MTTTRCSMRSRWPSLATLLPAFTVALLAAALPACSKSTPNPPTTQPPGPTRATIAVTCGNFTVTTSPRAGFGLRVTFPCTIVESAGLGANINFVRMNLTAGGALLERQEISATDFIAQTGTNRLNANQTRSANLFFDFNAGQATGGTLEFNFTDDRSNVLSATFTFSAGAASLGAEGLH